MVGCNLEMGSLQNPSTHRINGTGTGIFTDILHEWLILMVNVGKYTIAPENGWLEEDPVFFGVPTASFQGSQLAGFVSGRVSQH